MHDNARNHILIFNIFPTKDCALVSHCPPALNSESQPWLFLHSLFMECFLTLTCWGTCSIEKCFQSKMFYFNLLCGLDTHFSSTWTNIFSKKVCCRCGLTIPYNTVKKLSTYLTYLLIKPVKYDQA